MVFKAKKKKQEEDEEEDELEEQEVEEQSDNKSLTPEEILDSVEGHLNRAIQLLRFVRTV